MEHGCVMCGMVQESSPRCAVLAQCGSMAENLGGQGMCRRESEGWAKQVWGRGNRGEKEVCQGVGRSREQP